uniref:Chondroitin sulfate proteoglycan 4 n=1 Tax=Globodera rostochiensis TaxID=31243 RepID=A0A914HG45_GLORO
MGGGAFLNLSPTSALLFTVTNLSLIIEPDHSITGIRAKEDHYLRHNNLKTVFQLLVLGGQRNETISVQIDETNHQLIYIDGSETGQSAKRRTNFLMHCQNASNRQQKNNSSTIYFNSIFCTWPTSNGTFIALLIGQIYPPGGVFYGCVRQVLLNGHFLLDEWCRHKANGSESSDIESLDGRRFVHRRTVRLLDAVGGRFDDRLPQKASLRRGEKPPKDGEFVVDEGGTVPIPLLKQLRPADEWKRTGKSAGRRRFEILKRPQHGSILNTNAFSSPFPAAILSFSYAQILSQQIFYRHDGTETLSDLLELRLLDSVGGQEATSDAISIPIQIVPKNDAPSLQFGSMGPILFMESGSRIQLAAEVHLRIVDPDSAPELIWLYLEDVLPSLDIVDRFSNRLRRFSLAELLHGNVFLLAEGDDERDEGRFTLNAKDEFGAQSMPLTVHVAFAPLKLLLDRNMGMRLLQQTSQLIESSHLHFRCVSLNSASKLPLDDVFVRYSVVDQPKFGVVECLNDADDSHRRWTLCSIFLQKDIDELRVRYRHTNGNRTLVMDTFDFQAHCADSNTRVQAFQIDFVTLSIRVFVQESLLLNQTDQSVLSRRNLLATVFPHNFQPDQLVFNILEAPKLGMLLRHLPEIGKQRRVGVNSNFSQQQIDDGLISYKLHFAPFNVLNDFFTFRLLTPAGPSDETFRFELVYLPGGNVGAILLLNRTLIVPQGGIQQISNTTLWLESGDGEKAFIFRVALPSLNGQLALLNEEFGYEKLEMDGTFKSADIAAQRLFYEHDGDQSRFDRIFLLAESELRDPGGGKGHTPIAVWLHISVVPNNSHAPQLLQNMFGAAATRQQIHLLLNDERTLWPSLLPWVDLDGSDWPSMEQSLLFSVAKQRNSLTFHLTDTTVSRDFVIYAKIAPEMPLRDFTEEQLVGGELVLKHLGSPREETIIRYSVSDGLHSSPSLLALSASSGVPFVRLSSAPIVRLRLPAAGSPGTNRHILFLLTLAHLRAETNQNLPDSAIKFEVSPIVRTPFWLLQTNGTLTQVGQFDQMDLFNNKLFIAFDNNNNKMSETAAVEMAVPVKMNVIDGRSWRSSATEQQQMIVFSFSNTSNGHGKAAGPPISIALSVQANAGGERAELIVPRGGSAPIDWEIPLFAQMDDGQRLVAKHHIVETPKRGQIIFQRQKRDASTTANYNIPLLSFDLRALLQFGSLQYVHSAGGSPTPGEEEHDQFQLNITVQRWGKAQLRQEGAKEDFFLQLGPFTVPIQIYAETQLQLITPSLINFRASTVDGARESDGMVLEEHFLRVSAPPNVSLDVSQVEFRLVQKSPFMGLFNRRMGQPILNGFSHGQLSAGNIMLKETAQSAEKIAKILLRACIGPPHNMKCSRTAELRIRFQDDGQVPTIVHNIPLEVSLGQKSVQVSAEHLQATHPAKMPSELQFAVWQQKGGRLQKGLNTPLNTFTQKDLDHGLIRFEIDPTDGEEGRQIGFHFLLTDGRHQLGPEFFSLRLLDSLPATEDEAFSTPSTSSSTPPFRGWPKLEKNIKLGTAPGIPKVIGANLLKAISQNKPNKVFFHLTKQPMHGRLLLNGSQGRLERFTQADVDSNRLTYVSRPDIGAWSQRDNFQFKMEDSEDGGRETAGGEGTHRFRIESSYSNMAAGVALDELIPRGTILVSRGGAVALNSSHLNLTKLSAVTEDQIFVKLLRPPAFGWLERIDEALGLFNGETNFGGFAKETLEEEEEEEGTKANFQWRLPLSAEQLASGRFLAFHQNATVNASDEFTLMVYSGREPKQGLKLGMAVRMSDDGTDQLKIDKFVPQLHLLSGGSVTLSSADFHASNPSLSPVQIVYRIDQLPGTGLRLSLNNFSLPLFGQFRQADLDKGIVALEHTPSNDMTKWDVVGFWVGQQRDDGRANFVHSRILVIRTEPTALHLRNHSEIAISQGKTYVLLSSAHLGAESNGDRSQIVYNVTKRPANGTFYWVDGEKEASSFSQRDIDRGDVLHAQMNMDAFQDSFEFVLSNDEMELLSKKGTVRVQPVFQPQPFITNSRTISQLGLTHLNASELEGTLPRYLVIQPPKHGRLFLHPNTNQSALFFTHSDVIAGRLFFHAFDTSRRVSDKIMLELRSDSVQPARMVWDIEIRPSDGVHSGAGRLKTGMFDAGGAGLEGNETGTGERAWLDPTIISPPPPDMNYHFPIAILVAVVALVVGILLCRRKSNTSDGASSSDEDELKKTTSSGRKSSSLGGAKNRLAAASLRRKNGSMTVGKAREGQKVPLGRVEAMAPSGNSRRFGVETAMNEHRMGGLAIADGAVNLLESTVYATINSRRQQANREQQQQQNNNNNNNNNNSSSAVNLKEASNLGDVNFAFTGGSAMSRPSILSLSTSTTAPSSVSAVIPTFQTSSRRQSSLTRRIPTIALPPTSRQLCNL